MSGKVKDLIDKIIAERSKGSTTIAATTRTKLMLKGIDVDKFTKTSLDDQTVIDKLNAIAKEMNIKL